MPATPPREMRRKKIEEPFGWAKTVGGIARTTLPGAERGRARFTLTMAGARRRIAFGNGTLSVKRDFHLRPQVGRVVSWRDGGAGGAEISHVGAMPAPGHERMDAVGRNWA